MKYTFIRHSKTIADMSVNPKVWMLSDEGREKALKLSESEYIENLDVIYSSLQTKALETSVLIAKNNHIPIKTDDRLTEITSITNKIIIDYKTEVGDFLAGKVNRLNDGETIQEALNRFESALEDISKIEGDLKNIGIVSHGTMLSIFADKYSNKSVIDIHQSIKMPDLAIFDWENKEFINFYGGYND